MKLHVELKGKDARKKTGANALSERCSKSDRGDRTHRQTMDS